MTLPFTRATYKTAALAGNPPITIVLEPLVVEARLPTLKISSFSIGHVCGVVRVTPAVGGEVSIRPAVEGTVVVNPSCN